jgi:hypothetical protein
MSHENGIEAAATEFSYRATHHPIGVAIATPTWRTWCRESARTIIAAYLAEAQPSIKASGDESSGRTAVRDRGQTGEEREVLVAGTPMLEKSRVGSTPTAPTDAVRVRVAAIEAYGTIK